MMGLMIIVKRTVTKLYFSVYAQFDVCKLTDLNYVISLLFMFLIAIWHCLMLVQFGFISEAYRMMGLVLVK